MFVIISKCGNKKKSTFNKSSMKSSIVWRLVCIHFRRNEKNLRKHSDPKKNCCTGSTFFFRSSVLANEVFLLRDKDLLKEPLTTTDIRDLFWWMKYHRYRNLTIRVSVPNIAQTSERKPELKQQTLTHAWHIWTCYVPTKPPHTRIKRWKIMFTLIFQIHFTKIAYMFIPKCVLSLKKTMYVYACVLWIIHIINT